MTRFPFSPAAALLTSALALLGCTSGGVDIGGGEVDSGSGGSSSASSTGSGASDPLAGTWVGYVENYHFRSGSDVITLTVASDGTGTVRLGDQPTIPAAVDGTASYPEPVDPNYGSIEVYQPYEGFDFTALDTSFTSARAKFAIASTEVWESWCPLQTSYELNATTFACMPNVTWTMDLQGAGCTILDEATNTMVPIDCGHIMLCTQPAPCLCDATGCEASVLPSHHFDLVVDGDKLDGSLDGAALGKLTVHLARTP